VQNGLSETGGLIGGLTGGLAVEWGLTGGQTGVCRRGWLKQKSLEGLVKGRRSPPSRVEILGEGLNMLHRSKFQNGPWGLFKHAFCQNTPWGLFKHAFCQNTPWGLFKQRGVAKCPKWTVGVV
jgi:hypothetical protein